jgi:hypothetical protein
MRAVRGMIAGAALALRPAAGDAHLYNLRSDSGGPDEFAILPTKPLEMPAGHGALPPPTPGARTAPTRRPRPTPTPRSAATPRC